MNENRTYNRITLRGTITRTRMAAKNRAVYTIATDGDNGISSYPEVIHIISSPSEVFRVGQGVTAICHARSSKTEGEYGNSIYVKQIIVEIIYPTERILSSYIEGIDMEGTNPGDINEFIFCGEVYNVTVLEGNGKPVLLTLKIQESEKHYNYVELVGFKKQGEIMKNAAQGDEFAAAGSVRTVKKKQAVLFDYVTKDVCLLKTTESE